MSVRRLLAFQVEQWTTQLRNRLANAQFDASAARICIDNRMRIPTALHKAGVRILLGSDAPQQFNVPGNSLHLEMRRMLDAGMSPYDVLKSGTADVGEHFKGKDALGRVAAGQRADLMLLNANPLTDLRNAENRAGVMVRGRWLPESEIQARLAAIAAANQ